MKNIKKISIGKHTIIIVKLFADKYGYASTDSYTVFLGGSPGSIQYDCSNKQIRSDIYSAIAKWASELKASSIGGPILSGALLAEGVAAKSKKLLPFYIDKKSGFYKPTKHNKTEIKGIIKGNYIIVDDLISDGDTLETSLSNIEYYSGDLVGLKAILILDGCFTINRKKHPKLTKLIEEGKVFALYFSRRRK